MSRQTIAQLCAAAGRTAVALSGDLRADGRFDHHTLVVTVGGAQITAAGLAYPNGAPVDGPVVPELLVPDGITATTPSPSRTTSAPRTFVHTGLVRGWARLG